MSLYEDAMSAMDFDFTSTLTKLLGISEEEVADVIERLDVDDLTDLVDACVKGNTEAAREIIGSETEELEPEEKKGEDDTSDEPEIGDLIAPKDKLQAQRKKKKARILRKSETELGEDTAPDVIFNIGDPVAVDGEEATVKVPSGPGDTVGVLINGELKMVDKKSVHPLNEGVLGMTAMPGLKPSGDLQRIRELAGLPADSMDDPMAQPPMTPPTEVDAPEVGLPEIGGDDAGLPPPEGMGDVHHSTDMADIPAEEPAMDMPPEAPMGDMGADMGAGDMGAPAPEMGGIPSPGSALEDAAALDQAITEIENLIPNVKISEYKTLVARLEALVTMAKSAGKAALTETRARRVEEGRIRDAIVGGAAAAAVAAAGAGMAKGAYDYHRGGGDDVPGISKNAVDTNNAWKDVVKQTKEDRVSPKVKPETAPKVAAASPKADAGEVTGRKTLMDYVKEADDGHETIGQNRNDAIKNLQTRMGPGTTPQAAAQAMDAMMKDGGVKQMGAAFTMAPMDDNAFKTNMAAMKKPTQSATQAPKPNPGSNTTNPGANVQGASNSAYQGGDN